MRLRPIGNRFAVCLMMISVGCGDGKKLDEAKWNRLGDWKRRDGYWVKEDACLSWETPGG